MRFRERSFPGDSYTLPRPEVFFDEKEKLLIVATPWGGSSAARKVVETVSEYFLSTRSDSEATSPFRRLEYLSPVANNLRIATLVANEVIYREENRTEYRSGVELFAASLFERELSWVQIGQPNIVLKRDGQDALPLSVVLGLSNEVMTDHTHLAPLPSALLGVSPEPNIIVQSIVPREADSLLLISRSWIPSETLRGETSSFEQLSKSLSKDSTEPFWLGKWDLTVS